MYRRENMILTLWTIFLILSFALLVLGYTLHQTQVSDIIIIVGWVFMFALGVILLSNAVEYKSGEYFVNTYEYAANNQTLEHKYIQKYYNYTSFSEEGTGALQRVANSHLWGFLLMISGLFGAILFWFDVKAYDKKLEQKDED